MMSQHVYTLKIQHCQRSDNKKVMHNLRLGTWNLCLGLSNKKEMITDYLKNGNIDICCLQETEIPMNYPEEILNCDDYLLELEQNDDKKRVGIYISKNLKYERRYDLEKLNCHIIIIDVMGTANCRIIMRY